MNPHQLKLFYMAVKRGSLSIAANALSITQPTASKGINWAPELEGGMVP